MRRRTPQNVAGMKDFFGDVLTRRSQLHRRPAEPAEPAEGERKTSRASKLLAGTY